MEFAADYYATLGVEPRADADAIRRAYRKLMRSHHPDVNASDDASRTAMAINEAYACLHDPRRRAAYDLARRARRSGRPATPNPQPMSEFKATWGAQQADLIDDETPLLKRWKLVALGLAAIVTVITFAMTSSVDTTGARAPADIPASK